MEYEYKTETFSCVLKRLKTFNEMLQELLDIYANDGWKLHTMQLAGAGADICVCVFEREKR